MRFILFLIIFGLIACQKQEVQKSSAVAASAQEKTVDDILAQKDEACETSEMTEDKLVEQAMKPAKANEGGALQGTTDCTVE